VTDDLDHQGQRGGGVPLDVLREQVDYIDVDPYAVASHALRFGFPGAPDLLALMATGGREGFTDLLAACASAPTARGS
jgi:hypothetical protein